VGFGVDKWRTVSTQGDNSNKSTSSSSRHFPNIKARIHEITESAGQAQVTLLVGQENRDWNMRVIALDINGVEHTASRGTATPSGKESVVTYSFAALSLSTMKEFQVQVRPVHWIDFQDIALQPRDRTQLGRTARRFKPTGFGKVRQVLITELFDFHKGQPGVFPTSKDGTRMYNGIERNPAWSLDHGFDADAGTNELRLLQVAIADLTNEEWETLTPADLTDRLNRGLYMPPRLPSSPGAKPPLTYGFRTRDNTMGMLQILAFTQREAGATLRYKLMEPAHYE